MINLKYIKNQKINEIHLVRILFYTFPLWFIIGNLAISIHTLLFIVASLFLIQRKQLALRFNNSCWLLIAFFLYFFISTTIQFHNPGVLKEHIQMQNWPFEQHPIFKSFVLIRFLILIFIIDILFFNKIVNLKKLFLSSLLCTSFVSFDIILQYITGFDLFGFKTFFRWNSGPFGNEMIAGAYLKNFSFFSFFYIFETFKNKKFSNLLLIFIIAFHLLAALLTGNRMPMILFLFGCVLIILLIKNLRFTMSVGLLIFLSIFFLITAHDGQLNNAYKKFYSEINIMKLFEVNKNTITKQDTQKIESDKNEKITSNKKKKYQEKSNQIIFLRHSAYNRIYRTSILIWKEQPLFGFGLKSFRIKCWDMLRKDNAERYSQHDRAGGIIFKYSTREHKVLLDNITLRPQKITCSNHAHNYYLELLSEAGIIGTLLIVVFFLILLKDSFFYIKKYNQKISTELILVMPVIINIFIEIWPIRSSGSFFTTWVATFFWLNIAIFLSNQSLFKTENANYK